MSREKIDPGRGQGLLWISELFDRNTKEESKAKPNWLLDYAINSPAYSVSMYNCQRFTQYTYKCAHVAARRH